VSTERAAATFSELRLTCPADRERPKTIRRAVVAFLGVFDVPPTLCDDVATAVGEALINVVEHAYAGARPGPVEITAHFGSTETLVVEVRDRGTFKSGPEAAERGFGLRVIEAIAGRVSIDVTRGTCIRMEFATSGRDVHSLNI